MSLSFSVYFNLKYASCDFKIVGSWFNYFMAILFAVIIILAPIFILFFYNKNFSRLEDEEFISRFGAVYEGLRVDRRTFLVYMIYFIIRRCIFSFTSILLYEYVII